MDSAPETRAEPLHSDRVVVMPESDVRDAMMGLVDANAKLGETIVAQADQIVALCKENRELRNLTA